MPLYARSMRQSVDGKYVFTRVVLGLG